MIRLGDEYETGWDLKLYHYRYRLCVIHVLAINLQYFAK